MHGAFEQTVDQIINQSNINNYNYSFYVGCEKFNSYNYDIKNVNRIFTLKFKGPGVILYGLISFLKMYFKGVRDYFVFGYALSPFFKFMEILVAELFVMLMD